MQVWLGARASNTLVPIFVQLPGRENRRGEAPHRRLLPLVDVLEEELGVHLSPPYAFLGTSMGALVAFELARRLRDRQLPLPALLIAAAHRAPHLPQRGQLLHRLSDKELVRELGAQAATPREILESVELMQLLLPVFRADLELCETYAYQPAEPLPVPILALGGEGDRAVSRSELEEWRAQTSRTCRTWILPGGHMFLADNWSRLLAGVAEKFGFARAAAPHHGEGGEVLD
jgi:medium-chain acyl-[acyl-carrier-protein] hydrolase